MRSIWQTEKEKKIACSRPIIEGTAPVKLLGHMPRVAMPLR